MNVHRLAEALLSITGANVPADVDDTVDEDLKYGSDTDDGIKIESSPSNAFESVVRTKKQKLFYQDVIQQWKKGDEKHIYMTFWDFAGQSTYYSTHQVFISPNAVYLIVFDLSKGFDEPCHDNIGFRKSGYIGWTVRGEFLQVNIYLSFTLLHNLIKCTRI